MCLCGVMFLEKINELWWPRDVPWWRYQMETFSALFALCEGNSLVTGEFPSQKPVTRSFGVIFDLRLNKRLSKPSKRRWFETPSRLLRRYCNVVLYCDFVLLPGDEWHTIKTMESGGFSHGLLLAQSILGLLTLSLLDPYYLCAGQGSCYQYHTIHQYSEFRTFGILR